MFVVGLDTIQLQLLLFFQFLLSLLFLGLGELLRLLVGLALRLDFQPLPFGPRLGALLPALPFAGLAFAADRLQIGFEIVGAVIVADLFARLDVLDGADETLRLRGLTSDSAFGLQA